jgi:hypothetical protein
VDSEGRLIFDFDGFSILTSRSHLDRKKSGDAGRGGSGLTVPR